MQRFLSPAGGMSRSAKKKHAAGGDEPPTEDLVDLANRLIFGHKSFRRQQREVVTAVLSDADCFVLLPTGGGKSLCYQLPAVLSCGVTIVVSPLLALIQDQVRSLVTMRGEAAELAGIPATYLSSAAPEGHRDAVYDDLVRRPQPLTKVLYVTPEQLLNNCRLQRLLVQLSSSTPRRLARIIVDEAHCVSAWGHDFRPDYAKLGTLRRTLGLRVPLVALTATATKQCVADISRLLKLSNNCKLFAASFNRPNLSYSVVRKSNDVLEAFQQLVAYVQDWPPKTSGIVYCMTRGDAEATHNALQEAGISCACYHAGMSTQQRERVQRAWQLGGGTVGGAAVVCSTIAMGMGIDKPDVRFVAHFSLSKSLEGYYQESGRAGRDGLPSDCVVFYSRKDFARLCGMARLHRSGASRKRETDMARQVKDHCEDTSTCRRVALLEHFDEHETPQICRGMCDVCKPHSQPLAWELPPAEGAASSRPKQSGGVPARSSVQCETAEQSAASYGPGGDSRETAAAPPAGWRSLRTVACAGTSRAKPDTTAASSSFSASHPRPVASNKRRRTSDAKLSSGKTAKPKAAAPALESWWQRPIDNAQRKGTSKDSGSRTPRSRGDAPQVGACEDPILLSD